MIGLVLAWALTAHAGTWALREELRVQVRPPVPVGWVDGRTETAWLVDWTPGEPTWTARLCAITVDPLLGAVTTWPAAAVASVPTEVRPVTLDGTWFRAGPVVESVGVGDPDGDGHPGISLEVSHPRVGTGLVFVRQRATLSWSGELGEDGVVRGSVSYEPEQEQLGATTWWLRLGVDQRAHRREPSTFTLSPLDDGATCAALR